MALDIEAVRKKLEEERAQLLGRSMPPPEPAKGDEADMAATEQAREQLQLIAKEQKQRLALIEQALARIAVGKYGICDTCGKRIPPERMEAKPYATLCIGCQSKSEKRRK